MNNAIKVRFAPSPTGALHIGSVRTILYNYLFAKKHGGQFILRIEDTDQKRFVPGAEEYILESLRWLGIVPDEGPEQGGPYAPYKQSERTDIYKQHIQRLLDAGHAYYAFDSQEDIEEMRIRLKEAKVTSPQYNSISREWMKNQFTLPPEQVKEWIDGGKPYVIRLNVPHKEHIRFHDVIRGWVKVDTSVLDDKVLMKSDGIPTYHFASVVDDYLMQITHVIRGEEWLPSMPIHVLLYRYFGWSEQMPKFVHLPLLLSPNGTGKLSKRHADEYGFPAFPIIWNRPELTVKKGFREQGYLPEALLNFLALLGWSPGNDQELFTQKELIKAFSLERLGKSGAKFDITKANWFNQQHIKKQSPTVWAEYFIAEAAKEGITCNQENVIPICDLVKDRVTFPQDFWLEGKFFFVMAPINYDSDTIKKRWNVQIKEVLTDFMHALSTLTEWDHKHVKSLLQASIIAYNTSIGHIMPILRMAVTGVTAGPELMDTLILLGKDKVCARIIAFLNGCKIKLFI